MFDTWVLVLACVGAVFIVVLGLLAMLALGKYVFGGKTERKSGTQASVTQENEPAVSPRLNEGIVAAIVAAISAASGKSPSAFRIASIAPTGAEGGFTTPIWGRVERILRG